MEHRKNSLPKDIADKLETRAGSIEFRAGKEGEDEKRYAEGYAALFDVEAKIGNWFTETIQRGAFAPAIPRSDVRALFNHDPNLILARTKAGTLEIKEDEKGLFYRFEVPNTSAGNDFWESLKRGDISQSSFAFTVKRERWEEEKQEDGRWKTRRVVEEVEMLYDVSPVTYPAYEETSISARDRAGMQGEAEAKEQEKRQFNFQSAARDRDLTLKRLSQ